MFKSEILKIALKIGVEAAPVIQKISNEIEVAKSKKSTGGRKITKAERQEIAFNAAAELLPIITKVIIDELK